MWYLIQPAMKLIRIIRIPLITLMILFSACLKQKEPSVSLINDRFITTNVEINPGGVLMFKWIAEKGKADLASFTVRVNGDDLEAYGFPNSSIPPDLYFDSIPPMEGPVAQGNYTFSFVATDVDGKFGEKAVVVTVK